MTKEVIKNVVVEALVESGVVEASALEEMTPAGFRPRSPCTELSERQGDPQPYETRSSVNVVESENPGAANQLEIERLKLEYQFKMKQMELEVEREKLQLEKLKVDKGIAIQEQQLKLNFGNPSTLIPNFSEDDVDGFFKTFERLAERHGWPEEDRMSFVAPKLIGKAQRVYNSLDRPDDYHYAKRQILYAYAITPDGYRQRFRSSTKSQHQTFVEFATEKLNLFKNGSIR